MDNRNTQPAVETQYEDPPPREQAIWNFGIYSIVAIVAAIFLIVIIALVVF